LIKRKPSVLKTYAERLLAEGVIQEADVQQIRGSLEDQMDRAQDTATKQPHDPSIDPGSWRWQGFGRKYSHDPVETGVKRETLNEIAQAFGAWPEHFEVHKTLEKLLVKRRDSVLNDEPLDWGTAESLAYGSLLIEGYPVRLTGQDSRRGTFSHRHAVVRNAETGEAYTQLNHLREMGEPGVEERAPGTKGADGKPRQGRFCIYDSPLSEFAVLAFEYGYSLADPNMLVIWEAQFGDFANGAQTIIDQYIASAEIKWQRWSGLTLLLPHAYEGQGPEHSSARLERFLQLAADDNIQVVYPTTPAQGFHMFRRQLTRRVRKPLIVMSPKSLLRLPEATSRVAELTKGHFQEIIDDPAFDSGDMDRKKVKQINFCSGKVYYDLVRRREEAGRDDVAIIRVEQLYPLHHELLNEIVGRYPAKAKRVWVQEEPRNAGAYWFMFVETSKVLGWKQLDYIGRPPSATPATGSKKQHEKEQNKLLDEAIGRPAAVAVGAH
ncbi:MAG: 2-oxoglutarate dehydrogenase E1 component, partial [Planctomycetota bacterium]|nr:2-oxoglutarate dehydrogenase E1 component [Planctomycetota bacterium]